MFAFENDVASYLDIDYEDLTVTNLLDKYSIQTNSSFLYNQTDDYRALAEYISSLYIENQDIPKDILFEINTNLHFKAFLVFLVNEKMQNILADNSTVVFKEVVTIVNLLSFGRKYEIFESYDFYNLEKLGTLFKDYEKNIQELFDKDEEDYEITFNQYVALIETINELCLINSTDVLRKKTINPLIDTISETINTLKYSVQLSEEKINRLNNILGKLLFFYSHIPYINTINKDAKYLIEEFTFNFEKICNGYHLSKNTNFGVDKNKEKYYQIYLNSITTILLTLIYKLENTYEIKEYDDINLFKEIIELYIQEVTHKRHGEFSSLGELKKSLLTNYNYIYDNDLELEDSLYILDEFIEKKDFNNSNMSLLHSLILFSNNIKEEKLLKIISMLISLEKFKNDYHEFYKLNICDVIINRFINNKNKEAITQSIVEKIVLYIEKNKIASHLMSIYSKLYLSLSYYYSDSNTFNELEKSKLYYYNYLAINGKDLLENEYDNINKEILHNHGKRSIDELNLENVLVSDAKYIEIGAKLLDKYFEQQDINLKFNINQKLSNIVTEIFTDEGLNDDTLNHYIEAFISRDIFHGLTFVAIDGLCEHECRLIDLGYEKIEIPLLDGYKLKMAYSNVYKHIFESIYEKNKEYIKQNIINLIVSYIKSIPIYHDTITGLKNQEKLETDLLRMNNEEFIFIEIYIKNLESMNRKYGYKKTNNIFKSYIEEISLDIELYRLTGPKVGFILKKDSDYTSTIEKIKNINFKFNEEFIKSNLIIAVSWGNANNIIDKSSHCMSLAQNEEKGYYEFK